MKIAQTLLGLTSKMMEEASTSAPPLFDIRKGKDGDPTKATDREEWPKGKKGYDDLERGVGSMNALADPAFDARKKGPDRERITMVFTDQRHITDAMRALADDPEIGHPTYELGTDGKSMVFPMWKMSDDMKGKAKKAVALLKKMGIAVMQEKVVNHSKGIVEPGEKAKCPRCKGAGATFADANTGKKAKDCDVCDGEGEVIRAKSGSGWMRSTKKGAEDSKLY